ncbi:phytoene desaturase family protein [Sulfurifustis variabilis]|uniref:phytoene desaturase family protein n=1 Tax=Sulfurifustis variabilis TaxID=1675686 RepID=UPI000BBB21BB|nr:NAD(P)/FAD-dependent oxidoreductase [Sulfurifustis variabilis]
MSRAAALSSDPYDVVVIGAGHNGLVAAAYLARAGLRVIVLERRDLIGGACVTEELWPGFKVSTASYVCSLLRPRIVRELELRRHGLELLPRNPSSFSPFPDGRYLMLGPDRDLNRREIAKFSSRDADALPHYEAMLERVADFIEPTLEMTPPDPWSLRPRDLYALARLGWRFLRLGRRDGARAIEVLTGSARAILDRWFESEELKATLATDAVIGAFAAPSMPGTAYVLFHHVMGECNSARGVWCYVRGGMGGISQALAAAARAHGAEIRTGAPVARIAVREGKAAGVVLEDGSEIEARQVVSNADAHVTFLRLLDPRQLPAGFGDAVRAIDYASPSLKINLALSALPVFAALPGAAPGPQHRGTIHVAPSLDYIERAFDDAKYGRPSRQPILECTIPSVVDPTVAPSGRHLMSVFVQYAPYRLAEGTWDDAREAFADRCLDVLAEYAPNMRGAVVARQVLAPPDLEERFALTGGNIFQGAMTLGQLFFLRPVPGYADYRAPIAGLYLCGAATHPGGGVMGACGFNAAREMLRDAPRFRAKAGARAGRRT